MAYVIDTNILLRLAPTSAPDRQLVLDALRLLRSRGETFYYMTQMLAEFWVVCSRLTTARCGYGLTPAPTERNAPS